MKKYFLFFVISVTIFFAHALYTNHAIYGDGNGYYSYTQALFFEKSLDFDPIYKHLQSFPSHGRIFSRVFWGTKNNPFWIGTGITWLPSMVFMSFFSNNRFDLVYELGPGLSGIIFSVAGLYFLEKYLITKFSKKAVHYTILSIFFGSNIFYYTAFEPALSHQPAFFLVSLLLYLSGKERKNVFLMGLLSGLLSMVRFPDSILLIPVLFSLRKEISGWPYFLLGFLITVSPQIVNQAVQYGGIFVSPYLNGQSGTWQFAPYHLLNYLISSKRGLFIWCPILLLGTFGLIKSKSLIFLATLTLMWLVTSSWGPYLSAGFGQRLMYSAIPYFAIGIAYLFAKIKKDAEIILYTIPFVLLNFTLLAGFYILDLGR